MNAHNNKKPLIPFGWLRVLLFACFYLVLLVAASLVLGLIIGVSTGSVPDKDHLFFISFTLNAIISVLSVWVFRTWIDRKSFISLGLAFSKNGAHAGTGFFLGVLLVCGGSLLLSVTGHLEWTGTVFNGNDLFIGLGMMAIVAFYEELVFRGYVLNNLMDSMGKWPALLISSFLFAFLHNANPGFSWLPALNIFIAGILLGLNYIYTKNCWFGILLHFSWNFFQGPILGYEVSGVHLQSLFQHDVKGSDWLTGGAFGLEGSIIVAVIYLLAIGALVWVYEKKFRPRPAV